jgi:hypothetical protein
MLSLLARRKKGLFFSTVCISNRLEPGQQTHCLWCFGLHYIQPLLQAKGISASNDELAGFDQRWHASLCDSIHVIASHRSADSCEPVSGSVSSCRLLVVNHLIPPMDNRANPNLALAHPSSLPLAPHSLDLAHTGFSSCRAPGPHVIPLALCHTGPSLGRLRDFPLAPLDLA